MRAIRLQQPGGPEQLQVNEIATPSAGPDQVLVRVHASGVNFIDTYHRTGAYAVPLPFTPGVEGAGEVVEVGSGVDPASGLKRGARVAWAMNPGSYAEVVVVDAAKAIAIPEGVSDETAAAAMLQGMTAHYLVTDLFRVERGTTTLVHAAAGGVGLLLCQMIASRGGIVIGTVSSEAKADAARAAGAHHVIRYDQEDFTQQVKDLTDGTGVDVVYDGVGQATFEGSLESLRVRGMMALFGAASGPVPPFDLQRLNALGSLFVTRPTLAHYTRTHEEIQRRAGELFADHLAGHLEISISARYPLEDAAQAHRDLEARRTSGKLLLIP
jgi:NADPH:quinone reductase